MTLSYEQEKNLVMGILSASGFSDEDSELLGSVITHSDFTGVYSHGLSRLTRYLRQIKVGAINRDANFTKTLDSEAVTVFDGDNGFGMNAISDSVIRAVGSDIL